MSAFKKYNNFLGSNIYFWQKNYLIFLSPFWNLDNLYYLSIGRKNVCWPGTPNIWVFWFKSDCPLKILSRNPDKSYSVDFDNNFLAFKFTMYWEDSLRVWQYGLWSFQTGGTKLERFLPKNQHTQRKLLNFEFWINGELSFFYVKNQPNLSQFFFSLKNTNLGAHFLLLAFFDNINF